MHIYSIFVSFLSHFCRGALAILITRMNIIVVDSNQKELYALKESVASLHPQSQIMCFRDPMLAVKHGIDNPPDALYTAINMPRMNGFEVARMLREENSELLINFVADDDSSRLDGAKFNMNSYTIKPITAEKLRSSVEESWKV